MLNKVSKFIDPNFNSLVERMHGELELLQFDYEIVSVNVIADNNRFYGVIFYKWNGKSDV